MTTQKTATWAIVAITIIGLLLTQAAAGQFLNTTQTISLSGTIKAPITSTIIVTPSDIIGTNNLTLGTQLTFGDMVSFPDDGQGQTLMKNAGIKLVRLFDADYDAIGDPFVLSWNETSHTGTYNWTVVDPVIQAIYASGAQPLIVLMSNMATSASAGASVFTNGMASDSALKGLPYVTDAVSYVTAWVTHMRAMGYPVKYYEIGNEIQWWLAPEFPNSFNTQEQILAGNFATIYNATVTAMKQVNPAVSVSFDFSWQIGMMTWWLANYNGTPLDRIDFHRYEFGIANEYTDSELFQSAQSAIQTVGSYFWGNLSWELGSNPIFAQKMYYNAKGVTLPLFNTESNINSQWQPNTDPIIVQMNSAVFAALLLKTEILANVNAHIYYSFKVSLSYQQSWEPPSYGFGLINSDNHQPWYPYYVYKMIGNNLQVGDSILSSTNTENVLSLTWIDKGNLNILLINTFNGTVSTTVSGATGNFSYEKIDNTYSFLNAQLQTGSLSLSSSITMNGYTVILLTSTPRSPS